MTDFSKTNFTNVFRTFDLVREEHPGKVLFFRIGDAFECYGDDAIIFDSMVGIRQATYRDNGTIRRRVSSVPGPFLQSTIKELIARGHKIAIIEPSYTVRVVPD